MTVEEQFEKVLEIMTEQTEDLAFLMDSRKDELVVYRISDKHNPVYTGSPIDFMYDLMNHFGVEADKY